MASTILRAFLQVLLPDDYEWSGFDWRGASFEQLDEEVDITLKELESLSNRLEIGLGSAGTCCPDITIVRIPEEVKQEWNDPEGGLPVEPEDRAGRRFRLLRLDAEVPVADKTVFWVSEAARRGLEKGIYDLVVAANIARPGTLEIGKSTVIQDGYEYQSDEMGKVYLLRGACGLAKYTGWPEIRKLDLNRVWHWLGKQEGFREGFGGGPTGRAVNAFSRLFGIPAQDDVTNLLWALVGIEALYTEGQGSLLQQVKEKSQVLLGKQEQHRKKMGRMYDFRSRFVHGDLDFSGKQPAYENEGHREHNEELMETICFAEAILVASLQRLVELGWAGPSFTYQVSDSSSMKESH